MKARRSARLTLDAFLPYRLSVAANAVSQVIARAYTAEHDLSTQQWRLLAVLAEGGRLTQRDLVERTKMDKVTVSRAARSLENRALLRRVENTRDARSWRLSLTPAGRRLYAAIRPAALAGERAVLAVLDARERTELRSLLERVEQAAVRALAASKA